jgi:hypothetical protein
MWSTSSGAAAPHQAEVDRARLQAVEQDAVAAVAHRVAGGEAGDQPLARVVLVQPPGQGRQVEALAPELERGVVTGVGAGVGAHRPGASASGYGVPQTSSVGQ